MARFSVIPGGRAQPTAFQRCLSLHMAGAERVGALPPRARPSPARILLIWVALIGASASISALAIFGAITLVRGLL